MSEPWVQVRLPFDRDLTVTTWLRPASVQPPQWDGLYIKNTPPGWDLDPGRTRGKIAPGSKSCPTLKGRVGNPGRFPPVPYADAGTGAFPTLPFGVGSRATGAVGLKAEIADCRELLAQQANQLAALDRQLAPARARQGEIERKIRATHHQGEDDRLRIDFGRKGERHFLFADLMALSIEWGPLRQERAGLNREVKISEKRIEHLTKLADKAARKGKGARK